MKTKRYYKKEQCDDCWGWGNYPLKNGELEFCTSCDGEGSFKIRYEKEELPNGLIIYKNIKFY